MQKKVFRPEIRDSFERFINSYLNAQKFIDKLEENSEVILFGGAVRDYFENSFKKKPRDIDLVLYPNEKLCLTELLEDNKYEYKVNKFGGYKIKVDNLNFDVWSIDNTWAFKENKVDFNQLQDLNKTVFLSIDAVFYNLTTQKLYNDGYAEVKSEKELDIVLEDNPHPEINIMRARYFQKKYDLSFTDKLNNYFNKWLDNHESKEEAFRTLDLLEVKRYGILIEA